MRYSGLEYDYVDLKAVSNLFAKFLTNMTLFVVQFTDKLENMLDSLTATEEQVTNAEPVSAHPDKIREQMVENNVSGISGNILKFRTPETFAVITIKLEQGGFSIE